MNPKVRAVLKAVLGPAKRICETEVFWVRRHIVLAMELQPGAERLLSRAPVTFRLGSVDDLERLDRENHDYDERARAFGRRRLAAGDHLMLGNDGAGVVFYAWLMYGQMDLDCDRLVPAAPDKVYSYKVFTSPKYRGLGICPAYYCHIGQLLRERGYRLLFAQVVAHNKPSLIAHQRGGLARIGSFWEVQVGKRSHYWLRSKLRRWLRAPAGPAAGALPEM